VSVRAALLVAVVLAWPRGVAAQPVPAASPIGARPLAMRDLAPSSSVGAITEGSVVVGGEEPVVVLGISLDADIALGDYVKVFGSFPIVAARGYGRAVVGVGNFNAGVLVLTGGKTLRVAAGASGGFGATVDGGVGTGLRFDLPAFERGQPVVQGFAGVRADLHELVLQALVEDAFWDGEHMPGARLGGGARLVGHWLLGELRAARDHQGAAVLALELGLRGGFVGSRGQTWCARAGIARHDGLTALLAGIEVRTW